MKFKEEKVVNPAPDQGSFRQDPRSNFRINLGNKANDFLYKVGWKSDGSSDGRGRFRKGVENLAVPAVAGAALTQAPLIAGVLGISNIPGSFRQARNSSKDENATIGEKIRNTFPLAVNTSAAVFGAVNAPKSAARINRIVRSNPPYTVNTHRMVDPYANVTPSTKTTVGRTPNTVVQQIGRGEGHQGFANRGYGNRTIRSGWDSRTGGYQQASHLRSQAPHRGGVWKAPQRTWGNIWTTPPMPYQQSIPDQQRQPLQEIVLDVPYYGSPEFQEAYGQAEKQGLESFNFGGNPYTVQRGNPSKQIRTVTTGNVPKEIMDYPDYKIQHYPDSISVGAGKGVNNNYIRDLNYGVSGVPTEETTTLNKLKNIINKR